MNKKVLIYTAIVGIILGVIAASAIIGNVHASFCEHGCGTSTPHPTSTPHISPTPTATAVPTPTPCVEWEGEFLVPCEIPTATPSATPTEEPVVTPEPVNPAPGEAPSDSQCQVMDTPTILTFGRPTPNSVHVTWSETGNVSNYVVWYGTSEFNLPWNTTVQNAHEVTLNNVPDESIWVKVAANDGTCTGKFSVTIDP